MKKLLLLASLLCLSIGLLGQGSRILAPNYQGTAALDIPAATPSGDNDDFAWLEHDGFGTATDNFLDPSASAAERLYVYLRAGETLRYGIRRIPVRYEDGVAYSASTANPEGDNQDLTIIIYENDGTIAQASFFDADAGSYQAATLQTSNGGGTDGIIATVAESLLGPEFTFNSITYNTGGYTPLEYTNTTGSDQSFYIAFLQDNYTFTSEAQLITDINGATISDIDERSWYDLWDFTVYDGPEEKTGRLYCRRWNFTSQYFQNRLADEFQMYIRVPSTVGGQNAGNYIKELDLGGLDPFSAIIYANSEGSDGSAGDTNGDGTTDFQDFRQAQGTDIGFEEYDIFLQNPDISIWPTTTLPTVSITDAVFYCNGTGDGGEAAITFSTNQVGYIAMLIDLNGIGGYQINTTDVIIEAEITTEGTQTIRWDGIDGQGGIVANGTPITISGRFTSGPIHVPMFDVEECLDGINMLDVRPSTSFDLIYWDDTPFGADTGADPQAELDGTNTNTHLWSDDGALDGGDERLLNTWSFGFYQVNTENRFFSYICDEDGDGILGSADLDSDNDGVANSVEGDHLADDDADGTPNYLDADYVGRVDSNNDGVDDNFDADLDGIPNAIDVDSDNDGTPDLVENGLTDTNRDGQIDGGITDANSNGLDDTYDPACDGSGGTVTGSGVATINNGATNPGNAIDGNLTTGADLRNGDWLLIDLTGGGTIPAGATITITAMEGNVGAADDGLRVAETNNNDGTGLTNVYASYLLTAGDFVPETVTPFVLSQDTRYIYVSQSATGNNPYVNNVAYSYSTPSCSGGAALTTVDTDGDGIDDAYDLDSDNDGIVDVIEMGGTADVTTGRIANFIDSDGNGFNDAQQNTSLTRPNTDGDGLVNYRDIDSDNDGILDNVEAQSSQSYISSVAGDTDGDGLRDVYDPTNGGTFLTPVNTDGTGFADYRDADSDDDGVADTIEGWDANRDGFSDLDTDTDRSLADETGYNVDTDSDGLWDIYESSGAPTQNSDGAGASDWQDEDDDNDGLLTAGEDTNNNGNWTDDKTQGQGGSATVPDYLFRGDYDGDAVADINDADSDNDGILDSDEANGESIDPSGDEDGDGIANYQDQSDATVTGGLSSTADVNGDGVYDVYDSDRDGIPDFLDLDSDNDGLWDAIEADGGSVSNGLNTTTGQFNLQDPDNDGLMNYVDSDDVTMAGTSDLANPDSDGDGRSDYLDIDSDDDGITDIIEAQTQAGFIGLLNVDADGDGIDDAFDPSEGGILLDPVNTDGLDLRDYLDDDSDNDGVLDISEGSDADQDGYGDWDMDTDNDETDEAGYGVDTDADGLSDIFDNVSLGTTGNETGSNASLPNTDGIDNRNWRDTDDDNDGILTEDEDENANGDFGDDLGDDPSAMVPNFLFHGDFDGDGILDANDGDSDNDGILDVDEDGGTGIDPSADADGDGIPNYKDSDLAGFVDIDGNGIDDRFDADGDGIPDFRDRDSDNDGMPDIVEQGGTDADGDGEIDGNTDTDGDGIPDNVDVDQTAGIDNDGDGIDDAFDASETIGTDTDADGILDTGDLDIDGDGILNSLDPDNGGTAITPVDSDGDGYDDHIDLDSDGDGIPDLTEAGGTDADGDGKVDDLTDTDLDGLPDSFDGDNGGTILPRPDTDHDGIRDYLDVDSDNDGVPDPVDNGGSDTNNDGLIDGFSTDTDGDGLADAVDPDNGGTSIANADTDGDGLQDYLDLDADNDGYPDILEAGGQDGDGDGIVDTTLDTDGDTIPDYADVTQTGGADTDVDGIDDAFDVDFTAGTDTDGDGIPNAFDHDDDGNGFDDFAEANPYGQEDKEGDGFKDFRDLDSDGDGIVDVTEFGGLSVDSGTGQIGSFSDGNSNGWNDAQEATPITPNDSDSDGFADYQDIDSDNDGLPDNIEGQTRATYIAISNADSDNDGLDDAYDPNNGGSLISPPNTDGTGNADYLDLDSDDDTVPDMIEGANDDRSQYADWDTGSDNDVTDETGYNTDTDSDGLWDVFDNDASNTSANVVGSDSDGQDSDNDGTWDFQDADDDADTENTVDEDDDTVDSDPTNDFADGGTPIPDYLFGIADNDGDGVDDDVDADADNDGVANTSEDGGTGIDPAGDEDGDGILNAYDDDMDGDGIPNEADTDADGDAVTDSIRLTDSNNDGIADELDKDLDGVPDFRDLDSDNDGIADIIEFGLTDTNEDGTLDEGGGITDANSNGLDDAYDPSCGPQSGNAVAQNGTGTNGANALGNVPGTFAEVANGTFLDFDLGVTVPSGNTIILSLNDGAAAINATVNISQSPDDVTYTNVQGYTATTGAETAPFGPINVNYVLTADARYIRVQESSGTNRPMDIHLLSYSFTACPAASAVSVIDSDSDGFEDAYDLDSDNDGIPDNIEAQTFAAYRSPTAGDADGDGILDVYDVDGTGAISPVNTDATGNADYLDADSDDDGVPDVIEAFDANIDGFGSWDADLDGDETNETDYSTDEDGDGILDLFDSVDGLGSLSNITGTNAERQDTDGDTDEDWRDTDDDGDGTSTSAEDTTDGGAGGADGDWTNDFVQGGGTTPDYLFNPDQDGDTILDAVDVDSDNDGIPNTDEYAGATYDTGGDPFDDDDSDGIYNYLDTDDTNHVDTNGDGVDDRVDRDRDGVPNFFDIDSDNDGILDAIEANDGAVPAGFNTATGRYGIDNSGGDDDDDDNDGLNDNVDLDAGGTPLAIGNFDADGLDDYLDIDSDNDGLSDNREAQLTSAFQALTEPDTDGDGLKDLFDGDNGGTVLVPVDTDLGGDPDYLDVDSDDDGVEDFIEGYDANRNGFSERDTNFSGDIIDESGWAVDNDGDGLYLIFDSYSGFGVQNGNRTYANLQDTDGDGTLDFRDDDDDNDGIDTFAEDVNTNGDWTDDKAQGGGATPDYLFFNDTDNDGIADGLDEDGDNDGLSNDEEHSTAFDPFGDIDGDGVFNYADTNDPALTGTLTDSNTDGIWDEYDYDLDGFPNFFDLDNDNDGIPDAVEANGGSLPATANSQGQFPPASTDTDLDGWFDTYDNSGASIGTNLPNPDFDGDGVPDMFDYDSDSDGINDVVEAGGSDFNGDGILDSYGDTDGDGLGNNVDPDNGGIAHALPNTDATGLPDYLDIDADGDGLRDWDEGFDDDEDDDYPADYEIRRVIYETANGNPGHYPTDDTDNINGIPDYLDDHDGDRTPNFLDPDNLTYFRDSDGDGIVDFFDPDLGGTSYANISGAPDNDGDMVPNYRDGDDAPLPLDWISFTATYGAGKVALNWQTANEVDVSHFDIEHSIDGQNFSVIYQLEAYNNDEGLNNYSYTHGTPVNGINYYRLNQVDFDGASDYSWTRVVTAVVGSIHYVIYPNPTADKITIKADAIVTAKVALIDMSGRIVFESNFGGKSEESIDMTNLNTGIYQLMIQTAEGTTFRRVMKK